ncbi:ATP-binding protein [Clostridiales bacterium FE2010]|nr:ATP-binding protein [Clostridiales bacterium FE2010]
MYINRNSENMIREVSNSFPCIVIYGPRQVGKSTTIDHLFGDQYRKVTLDDLDDRNLALQNPKLFLETYGWPVIIDEIQKAPLLLDEIKKIIDEQRLIWLKKNKPRTLMYILTGSNRFELQEGISESLAGRCGIIEMASLSQSEKYSKEGRLFDPNINTLRAREKELPDTYRSRSQVFEDIFQGGMPDIVTGVSAREAYFKSYINTYMEKDVRKLIAASSELQFRNFLSILALRTSQELHYDQIASNVGIDVKTCRRWISILETSGLVYLLQPYMANISNRIIKAPKLYFMDTGLCAYLCKWPTAEMLESCAMSGAFFENYVVSEIVKNAYVHNQDPKEFLFYYRDIDQKEIDLLYVKENKLYPIEIKKSISPRNPTRNFIALTKYNMETGAGLVIDTCDKIRPINENAWYYPVSILGM